MRRILLLMGLLLALGANILIASAQDADKAQFECIYNLEIVKDTVEHKRIVDAIMVLRFNKERSIFYSENAYRLDSLISSDKGNEVGKDILVHGFSKYGKRAVNYTVFKDFEEDKLVYVGKVGSYRQKYAEKLPEFNWQITNETKKIVDYTCQKAVCDFRGRRYEAWFTSEIPIKDGPWKFCGLPGLILSVADTAGHYSFNFVGFHTSEATILLLPQKYAEVSRKEHLKAYKKYEKDPLAFLDETSGMSMMLGDAEKDNIRKKYKTVRFDPMERDF